MARRRARFGDLRRVGRRFCCPPGTSYVVRKKGRKAVTAGTKKWAENWKKRLGKGARISKCSCHDHHHHPLPGEGRGY